MLLQDLCCENVDANSICILAVTTGSSLTALNAIGVDALSNESAKYLRLHGPKLCQVDLKFCDVNETSLSRLHAALPLSAVRPPAPA